VGDRIVFSGFDGSMPKGFSSHRVSVDRPKESLFQKVKVQCTVNFQDVEEVMVILSRPSCRSGGKRLRHFLVLFALSYLGASFCVWGLSGFVPWFLLPDFPFFAIVFSGLFVPGIADSCARSPALFREITASAPSWSMFLGSMALYFASREIGAASICATTVAPLRLCPCWRPSRSPLSSSFSCRGSPLLLPLGRAGGRPDRLDLPDRRSPLPGPVGPLAPGEE